MRWPRRKAPRNDRIQSPGAFGRLLRPLPSLIVILVFLMAPRAWPGQAQKNPPWDGSRATPVHQIPLKDELNQVIVPTESNPLPYSSRYTCEPCHDYAKIRQGLHFDAAAAPSAGRPGEPWVLVDEKTGTMLPLSYQNQKGAWNPADLGLTVWDFTLLFGRHMTGGGIAEPADADMTPGSRWNVSGKIEINCMGCHNATRVQNHSEWAKQVLRENFRWAATAASGMGEVGGMSSRLKGTWDIFDGPDPDDTEWAVPPSVRYNKNLFDSKHRALFDVSYRPDDRNCLACHSAAPAAARKFEFDEDVHSAAGIKCVSCHRNDPSHAMIRGYEGEAEDNPLLVAEDLTCSGCHLGGKSSGGKYTLSGRLGAPYPRHKGIPEAHFERLSCTVCHTGPLPAKEATRVRTSRANRLGIFGVARWATDLPPILEPVYIRDRNRKLTPHRLMWPAFWAEMKDGKISPLKPEAVSAAAGDILSPEKSVTRILTALLNAPDLVGTPVLGVDGKAYELNVDGGLDAAPLPEGTDDGEPVWAVKKDGKLIPLIPDFDPASQEEAADAEARIQKVLEALRTSEAAAGQPVCVTENSLYRNVEGYFDKSEYKGGPEPRPRLMWMKDGRTIPLLPEFERRAIAELVGSEKTLIEEQIGYVLKILNEQKPGAETVGGGDFVYISGGQLFRLGDDGSLEAESHEAAAPTAWPIAHQVRPARQSLGVRGCTDCHKFNSAFFFGRVTGSGPLKTGRVAVRAASSFMNLSKPYQKLFGLSFSARPVFKIVLFLVSVVVGSILLIAFLLMMGRLAGLIEKRR